MKIFNNDIIKAIDKATMEKDGVTSLELVERAAEAISCEIISRWRPNKKVSIFAGSGNNGADALAVARLLIEQGYNPEIFLFNIGGNRLSEECRACRDKLLKLGDVDFTEVIDNFSLPALSSNHLVIDGLFGTGLNRPIEGGFVTIVRYINESQATVVSIDVPSGLLGDWNPNPINRNIIHANLTLAIQFPRLAFFLKDNSELIGEWKVLDIELNATAIKETQTNVFLVEKAEIRRAIKRRDSFASKSDCGSTLLITGSYGMMGAAVLCAQGAVRSGVGKITVHSPRCGYNVIQSAVPEAMFVADKHDIISTDMNLQHNYDAVAVGPGIGVNELTIRAFEDFLKKTNKPVIVDADALNCIALRPSLLNYLPANSILTPHAGEFDRIFGSHSSDEARLKKAMERSKRYGIIIVLKGRHTAIVRHDGKIYFNSSGNASLATAGSGDVLTGLMAGLMAQGYGPEIASLIAVYTHGVAGEIASDKHGILGVKAGDIADNIGKALKQIMTI
ncbi:MAG: NAD(P)H-hydrate dehydratase [Bacteroidales bacterium]|nr:NAD(P)H-hydrate dehydratase [Bacteroidales bacterium]